MVELPPICTVAGLEEHEMVGGFGLLHSEASVAGGNASRLPSLRLAVIW